MFSNSPRVLIARNGNKNDSDANYQVHNPDGSNPETVMVFFSMLFLVGGGGGVRRHEQCALWQQEAVVFVVIQEIRSGSRIRSLELLVVLPMIVIDHPHWMKQ